MPAKPAGGLTPAATADMVVKEESSSAWRRRLLPMVFGGGEPMVFCRRRLAAGVVSVTWRRTLSSRGRKSATRLIFASKSAGEGGVGVVSWRRTLSATTTLLRVVGRELLPAPPARGLAPAAEDELAWFSHSSSGFWTFSVPLVIMGPELLVVAVAGLPGGRNSRASSKLMVTISISHTGGGCGLDRTARGPKTAARARRVEGCMMTLTDIEVAGESANERNFGQRMASPGNLGNGMECRRENLVDEQPLINNQRTVKECDFTQSYIFSTIVKPPIPPAHLFCIRADL